MRILIYGINYEPELTGVGKYSGEMARWLAQQGHIIKVITAPPYYPEWKVYKEYSSISYRREIINGVEVWRCPLWVPRKPTGIKRIVHLVSFAISSFPIMIAQILWRPNIVISTEPPLFCAPTTLFVSKISRSNSWLHIQDFEVDAAFELGIIKSKKFRKLVLNIERWILRRFSRVSTISGNMKNRLQEKGVINGALFPNWVDTIKIYPTSGLNLYRKELEINKGTIVALYSGNMANKQGLEILAKVAQETSKMNVEENRSQDKELKEILFVFCGHGPGRSSLEELCRSMPNVLFLDLQPVEKLNELLNLADIHLLPQKASAADLVMPSKLTGMLASGKPVIATAEPESEIGKAISGAGILVPPGDSTAFAKALLDLANNEVAREEMGRAARTYAENHLDKKKVLKGFEKEIKKLAG